MKKTHCQIEERKKHTNIHTEEKWDMGSSENHKQVNRKADLKQSKYRNKMCMT